MKLEDRIVERAAQLLVERLLDANEKPDRTPNSKAVVDGDGDLHCPDCPDRVFVTKGAYRQHRTKMHRHKPGGSP